MSFDPRGMLLQANLHEQTGMDMATYRNMLEMSRQNPGAIGSFDGQMGGSQGGFLGSGGQMSPGAMQQQMAYSNLTNPNQRQGLANNTGMMAAGVLNNLGSRLNPQSGGQPQSADQQGGGGGPDPMMSRASQLMKTLGYPPKIAIEQAAQEEFEKNKGAPGAAEKFGWALKLANQQSGDYKAGPITPEMALGRGYKEPVREGRVLVQDKSGDISQKPITELKHFAHNLLNGDTIESTIDAATGKTKDIPSTEGIAYRPTGELGNSQSDKELADASTRIASGAAVHGTINSLLVNIEKNGVGGGLPSFIVEHAASFQGILDFARKQAVEDGSVGALDKGNYLQSFVRMGIADAKTQSLMTGLAYKMATVEGGTRIVGQKEVQQMLNQLGENLSNPAAIRQALSAVKETTNRNLETANRFGPVHGIPDSMPKKQAYNESYADYVKTYADPAADGKYEVGKIYQGHRYLGGGYLNKKNWEEVK